MYTSPLQRTRRTAQHIADRFGLDVSVEPALIDIDYGAWQGLSIEEARVRWPVEVERWQREPDLAHIPDGEPLRDVAVRVRGLAVRLRESHAAEQIVLVGHDSVNRVLLLYALGLPLAAYRRLGQSPCAINEIDDVDGTYVVQSLNATGHLDSVG